jgi:hypothetical protein
MHALAGITRYAGAYLAYPLAPPLITITKSQGLLKEQAKTLEVAGERGRGSKKAQQAKRAHARDGV